MFILNQLAILLTLWLAQRIMPSFCQILLQRECEFLLRELSKMSKMSREVEQNEQRD